MIKIVKPSESDLKEFVRLLFKYEDVSVTTILMNDPVRYETVYKYSEDKPIERKIEDVGALIDDMSEDYEYKRKLHMYAISIYNEEMRNI